MIKMIKINNKLAVSVINVCLNVLMTNVKYLYYNHDMVNI